jgi:predicted dehydrogenase
MKNYAFVVGYKNHAERIIKEIIGYSQFEKIYVYHPEIKKKLISNKIINHIEITDNFNIAEQCLCIFVCSPSGTHVNYLKKIILLKDEHLSKSYIYCEKPIGVSQNEINWLKNEVKRLSPILFVGFNQVYSNFSLEVSKYLDNGKIGLPVSAIFEATHGLAFKSSAKKNWRFVDTNIFSNLIGNLGIHYIHLALNWFGSIEDFYLLENKIKSKNNNDVSSLIMRHKSGIITTIFLSYSTIYSKRQNIFYTNGSVCLIDNKLTVNGPRDTFNKLGEFKAPPSTKIKNSFSSRNSTLQLAVKDFIESAISSKKFSETNYLRSIEAVEVVLDIYEKKKK